MIPCVVYEDLPDYEDSEHRDAAEASSQPVGVFAVRENSFTLQKTLHQIWDFNDLNINVTINDAHGEGSSCQNFSSRWEFLSFLRERIDQIQDSRVKLEQRVAALRCDVDEVKQQNAEARELKELLQLHVEAERKMTENMLIGDVVDQQRWAGRQIRGNEQRTRRAGWWHEGLNHVPGEEEVASLAARSAKSRWCSWQL
ncbi:MAG: hypothetical protein LQ337_003787 [Flavoplaca oasis]|nr:MAG: hypothetical protein LQ337_003787 [Flavoplaca oasis]